MVRIIGCLALLLLFSISGYCQLAISAKESEFSSSSRKLFHLFYVLNSEYIEEVNFERLTDDSIGDILEKLDPFAVYLTEEEVVEENKKLFSSNLNSRNQLISVLSLHEISEAKVTQKKSEDILLSLITSRDGNGGESHGISYKINESVGYIRVNNFVQSTTFEIEMALYGLGDIGCLILDLRGNSGGLFTQGVATAGLFLPYGALISYIEGRKMVRSEQRNIHNGVYQNGKIVILVDEMTASTSELLAGALQDWDRALVIGRNTYGKGVVQRQVSFEDGSAARITVARYHTPSGRVIQKPYNIGEYGVEERSEVSSKYYSQLLRRPLASERGVIPDIIIEQEYPDNILSIWVEMMRRGVVIEELEIYTKKVKLSEKYNSLDSYIEDYIVPQWLIDKIVEESLPLLNDIDSGDMIMLKQLMARQIKASLAQHCWDKNAFYKVLNRPQNSEYIKIALEMFEDNFFNNN